MAHRRLCAFLFSASLCLCALFVSGCGGGTLAGSSSTTPPPSTPQTPPASPPAISAVSPASVAAGSPTFTLQISGSGFVNGSIASWNGATLTTTYVSATVLKAAVPAALAAAGGSFAITVANPDGQTSASSSSSVAVDNPAPTVATLSPASVTAGAGATNVAVTGTGFVTSSTATFGGQPRPTTVQSSTQLTMSLTAADLAAAGAVNVTVVNPAPGGGASPPIVFTLYPPPPAITSVTPSSLLVESPDTSVTLAGTGFIPGAWVLVAGYPLAPASVTATAIKVVIPASLLGTATVLDVRVQTPYGLSNAVSFSVLNPVPVIQSVSTTVVTAGNPGFLLSIQATGTVNSTQVNLNGVPVPSPFPANPLQVPIPASALAQVGTVTVTLSNPAPGGGTSNTATIQVIAGSNYLRTVNLPANALLWNSQQNVIYAAIPAIAITNASNVVAIDPASGNVIASVPMPAEPTQLAISDDQQYLYVGMTATATITRLKLPGLTQDIQWSVGPVPSPNYAQTIYDMHVAPGLPHTIAVAQEGPGVPGATELAIYDDGVARPNTPTAVITPIGYMNAFEWGADATTIYGAEGNQSGGAEFIYSVNAQGATLTNTNLGALANSMVYDPREERLYDLGGDVVDPPSGALLGSFPLRGNAFAVDSAQRRVYFLGSPLYPDGVNGIDAGEGAQITVYDQDHYTSEGAIVLPAATGQSSNGGTAPLIVYPYLIRWGTAGLAFNLGSCIYILDGPFVTPGAVATSTSGSYATPPPQLSGLSPETVVAGSPDVTITLTGQNFTAATIVNWRGNNLATTVLNNTQVQAVIPAADLASPTAGPLLVQNSPGEGLSNVLAFSVLPNLGTGVQLAALNLSGIDLAWNAASQRLYVAVLNNDSIHPQSIATLDPAAGTLLSTLPVNGNPSVLAISPDDQYLYTGFTNNATVQRYTLPGLTPDLVIPLGIGDPFVTVSGTDVRGGANSCDFAVSMGVAPELDTTIAVTQGNSGLDAEGCGATAVIDGATPRPVATPTLIESSHDFTRLTWGADATALYAQGDDEISNQPISSLTVSSTGVVFDQAVTTDNFLGLRPHFDVVTGLIYSDGGEVTQPSTLAQVGNFQASGLMVPDSTLGLAYFLGQTTTQIGGNYGEGTENYTLQIFNLKTYALLDTIVIPNVIGLPIQMIRWGASGLAFTTENGDYEGDNAPGLTYLLSGPEIASGNPAMRRPPAGTEHVRFTWKPRLRKRLSSAPQ